MQVTPRSSSDTGSLITFQAPAPPVGSVEVAISPRRATAAQKVVVGQDTPEKCVFGPVGSSSATVHADASPVGFVEVITLPSKLTATHIEVVGQETPLICFWFGDPGAMSPA